MIGASIQIPGGATTVIRCVFESHGLGMDIVPTPDHTHWSFVIDSVPTAAISCTWASAYELDVAYTGVSPIVDGYVQFNTIDPLLRDYDQKLAFAPTTIQFF